MEKKTKIVIAGIGGVGGFFGGLLAKYFENSEEVEIYFLARGEHLKQIQTKGLKIIHEKDEYFVKPNLATDSSAEIGKVDFVIVSTKSYDLDSVIEQLKPCIDKDTVVLPLLNGVDNSERIQNLLPRNLVAGGCVYIVSHLKEAGVIENSGNIQKLFFGLDGEVPGKFLLLEKLFLESGINAVLTVNISSSVWEKFHLVAANSTATSYYDLTTGEILADRSKAEFLFSLLREVNQIALAKGIKFEKEMIAETERKLRGLPFSTTSSMQRDFWKKDGRTELETIAGHVVRSGQQLNIATPSFDAASEFLISK